MSTTIQSFESQSAKFLAWFENEKKKNGLIDLKFYLGDKSKSSSEDIFTEANSMISAEVLEDPEMF